MYCIGCGLQLWRSFHILRSRHFPFPLPIDTEMLRLKEAASVTPIYSAWKTPSADSPDLLLISEAYTPNELVSANTSATCLLESHLFSGSTGQVAFSATYFWAVIGYASNVLYLSLFGKVPLNFYLTCCLNGLLSSFIALRAESVCLFLLPLFLCFLT